MLWRRKRKESKRPKTIIFQKFQPFFFTVDNVKHQGITYRWINKDRLLCTVSEYLMSYIKSDGYMEDNDGVMYPIQNIRSIEWKLVEEKIVLVFS